MAQWRLPLLLMAATWLSTFFVGAARVLEHAPTSASELLQGWVFAVPLMAILTAHEFGHYIAGRLHRVDVSPPYFIPVPLFLGTLGAVIQIRERIRSRNALLDIGAAGPIAGLCVALPVLAVGIYLSPIAPFPEGEHLIEGHSVLYLALIHAIKGPIPSGHDIWLSPTALAGWAGLLVTMINLIPFGQLDGGHVAYALLGKRQNSVSRWVLRSLPAVAVLVSLLYAVPSYIRGDGEDRLLGNAMAGYHWLFWAFLLFLMSRWTGSDHPPTEPGELSKRRRLVAVGTLLLIPLLFMPSWLRVQ